MHSNAKTKGKAARKLAKNQAKVAANPAKYAAKLFLAVEAGKIPRISDLLDWEVDPNVRASDGWTPLHLACYENKKLVRCLPPPPPRFPPATWFLCPV